MSESDRTDRTAPVLRATDLVKSFGASRLPFRRQAGTRAVRGVTLEVAAGETVALVGESGSGKSTVGRMTLDLTTPDSGEVDLLGHRLGGLRAGEMRRLRSRATMIFQDPFNSLNPRLTIARSIAEPMECAGTDRSEVDGVVEELIERVGLTRAHLSRLPRQLSGGQLQRVAIARALSTRPAFVVCDEPVAALDVSTQAQVVDLLGELQQERGVALLFITHDLRLTRAIADRVIVMRQGRVVEAGTVEQVYADPQESYTRELLSSIPAASPRERTFGRRPTGDNPARPQDSAQEPVAVQQ